MPEEDPLKDYFSPAPSAPAPAQAAEAGLDVKPATINDRFIAYLLDTGPFVLGYHLSLYWLALNRPAAVMGSGFVARWVALWAALYAAYHFAGNLSGGTAGKRLMAIRAVALDGSPLGPGRSLIRALGNVLSTPFNWGYLVALLHPHSRALHDLLAGTAVVETRPKAAAEAWTLFLAALLSASGMFGATLYLTWTTPTPADLRAMQAARGGLDILARIQEKHKAAHGVYADTLEKLADASGDRDEFHGAISSLFHPHTFEIQAGDLRYRVSASARDHRRTKVVIEGP